MSMNVYRYQIFDDIDEKVLRGFCDFIDIVEAHSEVVLEITSHGGLVFYGNAVFQKLQQAQKDDIRFTARVYGIAASSAADIVLACDRVEMADTAAIMIHSARNANDNNDPGIAIANAAQLSVIQKRLPNYTEEDLSEDRWFSAQEALTIGLIDSIFSAKKDVEQARLCAMYLAKAKGGTMEEEKKEEVIERENVEETKERREDDTSIEDVLERVAERLDDIEKRLQMLENGGAACGDDERERAKYNGSRLKAVYDKIAAISAPCMSLDSVTTLQKKENPKAEFEKFKTTFPNVDRLIGKD